MEQSSVIIKTKTQRICYDAGIHSKWNGITGGGAHLGVIFVATFALIPFLIYLVCERTIRFLCKINLASCVFIVRLHFYSIHFQFGSGSWIVRSDFANTNFTHTHTHDKCMDFAKMIYFWWLVSFFMVALAMAAHRPNNHRPLIPQKRVRR